MNQRAPTLVLGLGILTGCEFECRTGWLDPEPIALGIGGDLHVVIELEIVFDVNETRQYSCLAVGTKGTIVAWGSRSPDDLEAPFVDVFDVDLDDFDLHAVAVREGNWWVVGEAGTAVVSADLGRSWTHVDLGTTADLRGITDAGLGLVVVGEGVILVQAADGTWTEATAPVGGWGALRAVHHDGSRVHAVGLGGVIWSAVNPSESWEAVDIGVDTDLVAIGQLAIDKPDLTAVVGSDGSFLTHGPDSGWKVSDLGIDADLIDYSRGAMLSADGTVYSVESTGALTIVDTVVGAHSLDYKRYDYSPYYFYSTREMAIVGDQGLARTVELDDCLYP